MRRFALKIFYPGAKDLTVVPVRCLWEDAQSTHPQRLCVKGSEPVEVMLTGRENIGCCQALVRVECDLGSYTFKPAEVRRECPIYVRKSGLLITEQSDERSYERILEEWKGKNFEDELQRAERRVQCDFIRAARDTQNVNRSCPTWLGVPGDMRIFELGYRGYPIEEKQHMDLYDYIQPRCNWMKQNHPDVGIENLLYRYLVGRGMGCCSHIERRLEEGYLPILHTSIFEEELEYRMTYFVSFSDGKPIDEGEGTDYLVADGHSAGHTFTEAQRAEFERRSQSISSDFPILRMRIRLINHADFAKVGFVRLPHINTFVMAEREDVKGQSYDGEKGWGTVGSRVYLKALLNGRPCEALETAPVVFPSEPVDYHLVLFHGLAERSLTDQVNAADFDSEYAKVRQDWKRILAEQAQLRVPERRINEMWQAGYWHILLNTFLKRNSQVAAATVGVYCPIGSESATGIEFLDSCGNTLLAEKSIAYFFAKQRPDGFIQNMVNYMLETGGTLRLCGQHFRYTRDIGWLRNVEEPMLLACDYLLNWIAKNSLHPDEPGYGMIDGQVVDPIDNYRLFSLNAYAYDGLRQAAALLKELGNDRAEEIAVAAETLRRNIERALRLRLTTAALTPVKDGSWLPLLPPWAETDSAVCLHTNGFINTTHASSILKDSLLSVATLIRFGVLRPEDELADLIVQTHEDLFTEHSTAFSQPYYNAVPYALLRRGEVNAYLDEFYHAMAALADRETYSFWEHYFLATPHKIAEESQFLMRLRELLYYEDSDRRELHLFRGVPDRWKNAKDNSIVLRGARCLYGALSVAFTVAEGGYQLTIDCHWNEEPPVETFVYLPVRSRETSLRCNGKQLDAKLLQLKLASGTHVFALEI